MNATIKTHGINKDLNEKSGVDSKQDENFSKPPRCDACLTVMQKTDQSSTHTWKCPFCGSVRTKDDFTPGAKVKEANSGDS